MGEIQVDVSDRQAPYIVVKTDGVSRRFLLDTGRQSSIITSLDGVSKTIEIKEGQLHGNLLADRKSQGTVILNSEIEGLGTQEVTFLYEPGYQQNIFGYSDFISKTIVFDFKRGLISYAADPLPCQPKTKFKRRAGTHVLVPFMIKGRRVWLVWDTGAGSSFIGESWADAPDLPIKTIESYSFRTSDGLASPPLNKSVRVRSSIGESKVEIEFLLIALGKLREMLDEHCEGILGYNVIRNFTWVFDHENKRFCAVLNRSSSSSGEQIDVTSRPSN